MSCYGRPVFLKLFSLHSNHNKDRLPTFCWAHFYHIVKIWMLPYFLWMIVFLCNVWPVLEKSSIKPLSKNWSYFVIEVLFVYNQRYKPCLLQCSIDLKNNVLVIGTTGTQTPFLSESEVPEHARLNRNPSVSDFEGDDRALAEALAKSSEEAATGESVTIVMEVKVCVPCLEALVRRQIFLYIFFFQFVWWLSG